MKCEHVKCRARPELSGEVSVLRRDLHQRLGRERRRMIKSLNRHPRAIIRVIERGDRLARFSSFWRSWRHELREQLKRRAANVREAVERATAVYMPNRSHAARIEIKKLRYTAELAVTAGLLRNAAVLDEFKKVQNRLGMLHDLHVLSVALAESDVPESASAQSTAHEGRAAYRGGSAPS